MADVTDLNTLLDHVLEAATAALDTIPGFAPGLEGAPARTYITDGQPSLQCSQLTVNAATIREGATEPLGLGSGTRHRQALRINHVGVNVWATRCRPNDIPPDPARMSTHSEQHNADGWALWNYMWNINRAGSTDPIISLCDEVFFDAMTPIQPSGQISGWLLAMRLQLAGYGDGANP